MTAPIRRREMLSAATPGDVLGFEVWGEIVPWHVDGLDEHRDAIRRELRDLDLILDEAAATEEGLPIVPLVWCERCLEAATALDSDGVCRACAESRETVPPAVFAVVPVAVTELAFIEAESAGPIWELRMGGRAA